MCGFAKKQITSETYDADWCVRFHQKQIPSDIFFTRKSRVISSTRTKDVRNNIKTKHGGNFNQRLITCEVSDDGEWCANLPKSMSPVEFSTTTNGVHFYPKQYMFDFVFFIFDDDQRCAICSRKSRVRFFTDGERYEVSPKRKSRPKLSTTTNNGGRFHQKENPVWAFIWKKITCDVFRQRLTVCDFTLKKTTSRFLDVYERRAIWPKEYPVWSFLQKQITCGFGDDGERCGVSPKCYWRLEFSTSTNGVRFHQKEITCELLSFDFRGRRTVCDSAQKQIWSEIISRIKSFVNFVTTANGVRFP